VPRHSSLPASQPFGPPAESQGGATVMTEPEWQPPRRAFPPRHPWPATRAAGKLESWEARKPPKLLAFQPSSRRKASTPVTETTAVGRWPGTNGTLGRWDVGTERLPSVVTDHASPVTAVPTRHGRSHPSPCHESPVTAFPHLSRKRLLLAVGRLPLALPGAGNKSCPAAVLPTRPADATHPNDSRLTIYVHGSS